MAKLRTVRLWLITLQLISLIIATVILVVYYNPWIGQMIDEAERSGNASQSLADQIGRVDGEQIVIFLMSVATILVSLIGIIGTLRGHEHNHCLLNFYMSTLILFLFVIFVALCGTMWEMVSKLQNETIIDSVTSSQSMTEKSNNGDTNGRGRSQTMVVNGESSTKTIIPISSTWSYLIKSIVCIMCSAILYYTSLRLTKKILESSDDRFLSTNEEVDDDDLHSEASSIHQYITNLNGGIRRTHHVPASYSNHSFHHHYPGNLAMSGVYNPHNMIIKPGAQMAAITGSSDSSVGSGSPYRNI